MQDVDEKFIIQSRAEYGRPHTIPSLAHHIMYRCHHTETEQQILNENGKFISITELPIYMGVVEGEVLAPSPVLELRLENSFSFNFFSFSFGQTKTRTIPSNTINDHRMSYSFQFSPFCNIPIPEGKNL